jgi:HPt (histidine-containing phosphotransfer) domain-containing protein
MEQQIAQLKQYYLSKLPSKIDAIESAWQDYLSDPTAEKMQTLYRQAHNMSGSAGTYGYKEISDIAKKMDKILRGETHLSSERKDKVTALIAQLRVVHKKIKR